MYRLDKIDLQLVHVVPAIERFGAAAGNNPGRRVLNSFCVFFPL